MSEYDKQLQELDEKLISVNAEIVRIKALQYAELNLGYSEIVGKYYLNKVEPSRYDDSNDIFEIRIFKVDSLHNGQFTCTGYGIYSYNSTGNVKFQLADFELSGLSFTEISEEEYNKIATSIKRVEDTYSLYIKDCDELFGELLNHP